MRFAHSIFVLVLSALTSSVSFGLDFTLGLRAGNPVNPVPCVGAETFLHFGNFAIGLSHVSSQIPGSSEPGYDISADVDDGTEQTNVSKAIATASMTLIEARYFLFWGLNGTVGLGQRTMGLEFDITESDNISRLEGSMTATSFVVSHTIGVEWHFGWWYFALDGIGYAYPLSTTSESRVSASGNLSGDLGQVDEDLEDAANQLGHVISKQLFLISLGIVL